MEVPKDIAIKGFSVNIYYMFSTEGRYNLRINKKDLYLNVNSAILCEAHERSLCYNVIKSSMKNLNQATERP